MELCHPIASQSLLSFGIGVRVKSTLSANPRNGTTESHFPRTKAVLYDWGILWRSKVAFTKKANNTVRYPQPILIPSISATMKAVSGCRGQLWDVTELKKKVIWHYLLENNRKASSY